LPLFSSNRLTWHLPDTSYPLPWFKNLGIGISIAKWILVWILSISLINIGWYSKVSIILGTPKPKTIGCISESANITLHILCLQWFVTTRLISLGSKRSNISFFLLSNHEGKRNIWHEAHLGSFWYPSFAVIISCLSDVRMSMDSDYWNWISIHIMIAADMDI